jgi:hypothetical protein
VPEVEERNAPSDLLAALEASLGEAVGRRKTAASARKSPAAKRKAPAKRKVPAKPRAAAKKPKKSAT